jgi:hypothetical protein
MGDFLIVKAQGHPDYQKRDWDRPFPVEQSKMSFFSLNFLAWL